MAKSLRSQIIKWAEETGGFGIHVTGGVVGSFLQYEGEELIRVVHFIVGLGHTTTFTDRRILQMQGNGYLAGIVRNFAEFKELVCGITSTSPEEGQERESNYRGAESGRGQSPAT